VEKLESRIPSMADNLVHESFPPQGEETPVYMAGDDNLIYRKFDSSLKPKPGPTVTIQLPTSPPPADNDNKKKPK